MTNEQDPQPVFKGRNVSQKSELKTIGKQYPYLFLFLLSSIKHQNSTISSKHLHIHKKKEKMKGEPHTHYQVMYYQISTSSVSKNVYVCADVQKSIIIEKYGIKILSQRKNLIKDGK